LPDSDGKKKNSRVHFNYRIYEPKYYLLTDGSGYPLADFSIPHAQMQKGISLVVTESRPETVKIF